MRRKFAVGEPVVLGVAGLVGLLACLSVFVLPASGQGPADVSPVIVAGGLDAGRYAYRVWSDGRVEINDANAQLGNGAESFKGWREVK